MSDHEAEVVVEPADPLVCQHSLAEEGPALDLDAVKPIHDYCGPPDFPPEVADARRVVTDCHCLFHYI